MNAQQIETYVDAAAAALSLPLLPEHRPGVLRYFTLAETLAQSVMGLPLGTADEPAEAFVPVLPVVRESPP